MRILAKDLKVTLYPTGGIGMAFDCITSAKEAVLGVKRGDYELIIRKPQKARTLNQNALLWELCGNISEKISGSHADAENVYCQVLLRAAAKVEYLAAVPEAEETLRRVFRAVRTIGKRAVNGKELNVYQCFIGSSQMTTEEMANVIDAALEYAAAVGIDTDYWKGELEHENSVNRKDTTLGGNRQP